ncbi:VOC family protein [Variovorax sp. J22R24]|uniref:VOC family protein n=1 Tax=Variovorax gracilis TaxID=3053502 RepID=UPI002575D69C|nr:VOC family protein [Variovorax sp. J22R24]MDM0103337.1 VOC family protein [Variovorax sp. J22R24]
MADIQLRTRKDSNRADDHSVHSLDGFVFTVPDLDEAARFYDAFGLQVERREGRLDLHTVGHPHAWGSLFQADGPKKLQYLRFGCFAEDLAAIGERIERLGVPRCEPHPLGDTEGIWVRHPDGFPVQVVAAAKSSPDARAERIAESDVPMGTGASLARSRIPKVRPRRLSHVLLFSPNVGDAIVFYQDALGLRLTDRSGELVVFMHGAHGSDHHLIAMAKSDGPGLHHTSWDVGSIDEVGRGMEQMYAAGYPRGWGVGRHVLGSNYFYYVRDPWGSHAEYSYDIDYVPGGFEWPAADHPPEDSFYAWGPAVPEDFITNFEIRNG